MTPTPMLTCDRCGGPVKYLDSPFCDPCDKAVPYSSCALCAETFLRTDLNEYGECFECVDYANATHATGA